MATATARTKQTTATKFFNADTLDTCESAANDFMHDLAEDPDNDFIVNSCALTIGGDGYIYLVVYTKFETQAYPEDEA